MSATKLDKTLDFIQAGIERKGDTGASRLYTVGHDEAKKAIVSLFLDLLPDPDGYDDRLVAGQVVDDIKEAIKAL